MKKQYLFIKLLILLYSITSNAQFVDSGQDLSIYSEDTQIVDIDNDGDLDIIFGRSFTTGADLEHLWINDGNGNYTLQIINNSSTNNRTQDIQSIDLDSDGFPELFTANLGNSGSNLYNNSNGTLSQNSQNFDSYVGIVVVDYDNDGDQDMFAIKRGSGSDPDEIIRFRNNNGLLTAFATPVITNTRRIVDIEAGEMNSDGILDLIIITNDVSGGNGSNNRVLVYNGDGFGNFTNVWNDSVAFVAKSLKVGRIISITGRRDIVVVVEDPTGTNGNGKIQIFENQGNNNYAFYDSFGEPTAISRDVAFGDLDGDNDLDAFVANNGENRVWLNNSSGVFTLGYSGLGNSHSKAVKLSDLDGDGDLDAVVANNSTVSSQPSKIWINNFISSNTSPTDVGTIPNINQVENNTSNQSIDLTQYFTDAEDGASGLTYSVTTTDPSYFSTNISGTDLSVNFSTGFGGPDTVTIQAEDSGGLTVTQSFTVTVTQQQCTVPTNVSISNISFFDADISWTGNTDDTNGYTWYVMEQGDIPNQGGATPSATGNTTTGTTSASVSGLNFNTDYDVYVIKLCSSSVSSLSSVESFTTLSCESVTNLITTNITDTTVSASWTASATAFNGYNWYLMNPGENPVSSTPIQNGIVTNTTVSVSGLINSTSYDLYIQSRCATGFGSALSTFVNFTTTASCAAPTNVTASNVSASSLDLSWTASPDATNGYRWYVLPLGSTDTSQAIETNVTTGTTVNVNATNLTAGTSYDAYVISRCSATVNSGLSLVETFTIPSPTPLITISGPASVSESIGSYDVTVTASQVAASDIDFTIGFGGAVNGNATFSVDYDFSPSNIYTIAAGTTSTTFSVVVVDDNELEPLERILIDILSVTNGQEDGVQQLETLIEDNEQSSISFTDSGQTLVTLATDVVLDEFDGNAGLDAFFTKGNFSDRVFFNDGSGALSNSGQSIGQEDDTGRLAVGNFDGSSDNSVILVKNGQDEVWLNNNGTYSFGVNIGSNSPSYSAITKDIDLDGLDDIIIGKSGVIEVYTNDYVTNNFLLDFSLTQTLALPNNTADKIYDLKLVDLDGVDGLDLIVATEISNYVFTSNSSGVFTTTPITLPGGSLFSTGIDTFDIDGNGFLDIVISNSGTTNQVVMNLGILNFEVMPLTPNQTGNSTDVAFVDLDNDGDKDIIFSNAADQANTFWENIGGVFADNGFFVTSNGLSSNGLDVGDIDGDGDMDVIFANGGTTSATSSRIWFNDLLQPTLSNNDLELQNDLKLYPNPVKEQFTIAIENNDIEKVEIYNLQGQLVKQFKTSETYNITQLESGLYFVKVVTLKGIKSIKVLKE